MKFKFNKNLDYQIEAVDAIVDIFDTGKNIIQTEDDSILRSPSISIIKNELELNIERINKNISIIQKKNKVKTKSQIKNPGTHPLGYGSGAMYDGDTVYSNENAGLRKNKPNYDFSIEMETGTGKTYVYLRTIFELNKKYGLKKFIILVPSVAIREGVLKTIEQTKKHFNEIYNTGFGHFAYDSSRLSKVREFSHSLDLQIMIMTIQSFTGDDRVMRSTPDRFNGISPISLVAETNPVIIMDEPQNMETELSKSSIKDLDSLFKLRYSATHKELHNLMYSLSPVDAYKKGLVKKIQVFGVKGDDAGAFNFKVQSIITQAGQSPRAKVQLEVQIADDSFVKKEVLLKAGDDLTRKTSNSKYQDLIVNDVSAQYNRVELSDGNYYKIEEEVENKEAIFRTQIRETIKAHFDKQEELGDNIKVLSLFFIDRVDNYVKKESLIRKIFIDEYEKLKKNYSRFSDMEVDSVHKGYFASKKEKGETVFKDTKGDSKLDKEAYDLIMKEKERLLSFSEPVSFIFSHSALKEGWDNPNIFQICTLRETNSIMKKRQEIGRGLRLPVDIHGNRIYDQNVNILTVIANESYQEYVGKLQQEFKDSGYLEAPETRDAKVKKVPLKLSKKYIEDEDFKKLWEKISKRTRFNLYIDTETLIDNAVNKINERDVNNLVVTVDKVNVYFNEENRIETSFSGQSVGEKIKRDISIGNIIERIARETGVTKNSVFQILSKVSNLDLIFDNPEEYLRTVILIIKGSLNDLLINDGLKYLPTGDAWEIKLLFEESECLENKSIKSDKSPFERVLLDSDGERLFALALENSANARVYTKLPRGFVIDTPLGGYTPDWAVVWKTSEGEKLYLVRETKFGYKDLEKELTASELQKILCGVKHFEAIGANFKVAQKEDLNDLLN